ncbi:MAG TPA: hypothetical protein V6D12_14130 [Candidatus Obscuribacterales bacterium]
MAEDFQSFLQNPNQEIPPPSDEEIIKEIDAENEKDYLKEIKKKNKGYLINLSLEERRRIARYVKARHEEAWPKHKELCDKIDEWDEVYRMVRKEVTGTDGEVPNYRTPISAVALEVVHANIMNVFFSPKDIMRVIPTEEGDIPKVKKVTTFGNWSLKNEMEIFERCDRLFHNSEKTGECPYIVHWVKEYGTEIKREILMNPANPTEPLVDPDTQEVLYQEIEKPKLLYNGPRLDVFSRKDYIQAPNAVMDQITPYDMRVVRYSYDQFLRKELEGKFYEGSIKEILDWAGEGSQESEQEDYEGDVIPVGKYQKEFIEFHGRLRINAIKDGKEGEIEKTQELEDEFIALVNLEDEITCSVRKNKFPLKMRPIGVDYFIPDDEGRKSARGIIESMEGIQTSYDNLFNQYLFGVVQSNNPIGFFSPTGNQRDQEVKIKNGYLYPSSDPNSVKFFQFPQPNESMRIIMELVSQWAQLLFGISDYAAGVESKIDPSAPARKAAIVVEQGNVRLNMIIKRKNNTLRDIFKRWFLLYKENMPKNKFMRITGDTKDNPWRFENVSIQDFQLNSIPDFELTGNVLNSNKELEANKKIAIYQLLIANPLFNPATAQGLQALHSLTKWLIDGLDDSGLSRFLPPADGEVVHTPEEENARFLQGDPGEPTQGEDHVYHIKIHQGMLVDPSVPDEIKQKLVAPHIQATIKMMQDEITQQMVLAQIEPQGGSNAPGAAFGGEGRTQPQSTPDDIFSREPAGMA